MRPAPPIDTRPLLRPLFGEFAALLRGLAPDDWARPTAAPGWAVRDVAAHVLDGWLRRLSYHRDGLPLPPLDGEGAPSFAGLVDFVDRLNAEWVALARRRLSPRLIAQLVAEVGPQVAEFFESLEPSAPAFWAVAWAGEEASQNWFDVGRDFTEVWHHQQQIREAVGARTSAEPRYLQAVLALGMRALLRAYAAAQAVPGDALHVRVTGAAGGDWTLLRDESRFALFTGQPPRARASLTLDEEAAWRLLYKALPREEARRRVSCEGDAAFGALALDALALLA